MRNLSESTQDGLEIVNQKLEIKLVEDIRKSILIPADDFPVHGVTWYGSAYYAASPPQNPRGPLQGEPRLPWSAQATKVWRGGGYLAPPEYLRVDGRWSACPDQCYGETGFRLAQTIQ
jgi:hypothetical protein